MTTIKPSTVSQSSTFDTDAADGAVDGDLRTRSHTTCAWNTDLWYKMKFEAVYCFSDIGIIQSQPNIFAERMDGTKVAVVNSQKGIESVCGELDVGLDYTILGQTYFIPCNWKCGDEVKLTLRHDTGQYDYLACIHMKEIIAFTKGLNTLLCKMYDSPFALIILVHFVGIVFSKNIPHFQILSTT